MNTDGRNARGQRLEGQGHENAIGAILIVGGGAAEFAEAVFLVEAEGAEVGDFDG